MSTDKNFLIDFLNIFDDNIFLIDPVVRIEFLRGAYKNDIYKERTSFLEFEKFQSMRDHHLTEKKVYENVFDIARIYSHKGNSNIPLGDIFIIARLAIYNYNVLFITRDFSDFDSILFDRIAIVSIERKLKNRDQVEHIQILRFNQTKYSKCLSSLP
jgi:predicted nucleic acid-binding protein